MRIPKLADRTSFPLRSGWHGDFQFYRRLVSRRNANHRLGFWPHQTGSDSKGIFPRGPEELPDRAELSFAKKSEGFRRGRHLQWFAHSAKLPRIAHSPELSRL